MRRSLAILGLGLAACGGGKGDAGKPGDSTEAPIASANPACPASAPAPAPLLPRVDAKERTLEYWLDKLVDPDAVVLEPARIRDMNASLAVDRPGEWHGENDLLAELDPDNVKAELTDRLGGLHKKLASKELVEADGTPMPAADLALFDPSRAGAITPELRVTLAPIPLRCGPRATGFYSASTAGPPSKRYDRNNCSTTHPQEVVQIVAQWPNGMRLARTRYAFGWIEKDAKLSPPIPETLRETYVRGARAKADDELALKVAGKAASCPAGTLLPLAEGARVHFADDKGFHEATLDKGKLEPTSRPLTRRALLSEAWGFLDTPYGWGGGGAAGGHDCSSFLMDLFATFDLALPRHSMWQARAGTFSIDVTQVTNDDERVRLIDAAAKKGVVLLGFPGHIMLYLGRGERGAPMVLHAIAEYVAPCPGGGETIYHNDKVTVSDLELGRGTTRRSLLERITTIAVIGGTPGIELAGSAELRPAAPVTRPEKKQCKDSQDFAIFMSPKTPNAKQPMRVIVTASKDPGAAELALFDPAGDRVTLSNVVKLPGGPPWSVIATVDAPAAGTWTAVFGDGGRIEACERIAVSKTKPDGSRGATGPEAPAWSIRNAWTASMENYYATFVQRLFDFPADQDLTWPNLHTLLRDPSRNILYDHLHSGEEKLALQPDCADLPYLLRAYFAWKLGLPFAYHRCNRGSASKAPVCKPTMLSNFMPRDHLDDKPLPLDGDLAQAAAIEAGATEPVEPVEVEELDGIEETTIRDVDAFAMFWRRHVANSVHAASGRTAPDDDVTDYYPVPLTREALKPGTAYHDPFGHVMVIAAWVPQKTTAYGILLAADAQPDGTVGRKRFWRGNFLFSTESKLYGAGFKAFRPAFVKAGEVTLFENKDLKRTKTFAPFSKQQYEGTADTFYDAIESIVNPRPLDPLAAMNVLVDSLHSQAKFRVVSVKNGEDWIAQHPTQVMAMPDGPDIFLTSGPWEDFATPSRDFRLLIAIDTVMGFPAEVKRAPKRFALTGDIDAIVKKLEAELATALAAKSIEYIRSDGKPQKVTMAELVERRAGFEVSYNPNDCIEHRWAAIEGSPERASCQRRAPAEQQAKLSKYRTWFQQRKRPTR